VLVMYLLGVLGGSAALLVSYLSTWNAAVVALLVVALMLAAIAGLERAPYERQKTPNRERLAA